MTLPHGLPPARVGPYLRALAAGLHSLAPHEDFVPLAAAEAHLHALDPALSGALLGPAEVHPLSGLPAFPWMERALAEQVLALGGQAASDLSEAELARRIKASIGVTVTVDVVDVASIERSVGKMRRIVDHRPAR